MDLNTASPSLLSRVAGLGSQLSENIVAYRNANGPFAKRAELKKVPRLGEKTFEQCAGFLRITGDEPLRTRPACTRKRTASPGRSSAAAGTTATEAARGSQSLAVLDPQQFVDESFGLPTVVDIISELEKPRSDPRRTSPPQRSPTVWRRFQA